MRVTRREKKNRFVQHFLKFAYLQSHEKNNILVKEIVMRLFCFLVFSGLFFLRKGRGKKFNKT